MDDMFETLMDLYREAFGKLPDTGGKLLDWAVNAGLITDEQRDAFYMVGDI